MFLLVLGCRFLHQPEAWGAVVLAELFNEVVVEKGAPRRMSAWGRGVLRRAMMADMVQVV